MGRKKNAVSKTVALSTDADGRVAWDAVLKQGHEDKLAVYTRPEDLKEKWTEDIVVPYSSFHQNFLSFFFDLILIAQGVSV